MHAINGTRPRGGRGLVAAIGPAIEAQPLAELIDELAREELPARESRETALHSTLKW